LSYISLILCLLFLAYYQFNYGGINEKTNLDSLLVITAIVSSACSASSKAAVQPMVVDLLPVEEIEDIPMQTESDAVLPVQSGSSIPAWYSAPLTDVNTGEVFSVEENLGK